MAHACARAAALTAALGAFAVVTTLLRDVPDFAATAPRAALFGLAGGLVVVGTHAPPAVVAAAHMWLATTHVPSWVAPGARAAQSEVARAAIVIVAVAVLVVLCRPVFAGLGRAHAPAVALVGLAGLLASALAGDMRPPGIARAPLFFSAALLGERVASADAFGVETRLALSVIAAHELYAPWSLLALVNGALGALLVYMIATEGIVRVMGADAPPRTPSTDHGSEAYP